MLRLALSALFVCAIVSVSHAQLRGNGFGVYRGFNPIPQQSYRFNSSGGFNVYKGLNPIPQQSYRSNRLGGFDV